MTDGWFIRRDKERLGPFTWLEMLAKVSRGELKSVDRIARKGMTKWAEARTIDGLFAAVPPMSVPPRPAATVKPLPIAKEVFEAEVFAAAVVAEPVAPPRPPVAMATPASKRSSLPYILAGVVGGGVTLLIAFALLCVAVYWRSSRTAESDVVAEFASQQAEATNPLITSEGSAEAPAPGSNSGEPAATESPASETADLQNTLQDLNNLLAAGKPQVPTLIAALVAKAEAGDVDAMNELGDRYSEGAGVSTDEPVAVGWYQKAAEGGCSDAMNSLAYMYMKGQGVEEDQAAAAGWFARGAQAGFPMAMFNYAICLGNGIGVPENSFQSRLWIQKSAEAGYEPAQRWIQQVQAEARANLLGAIVGGILGGIGGGDGGGDGDNSSNSDELFQQRRRDKEYWEDRARRADAAGDQLDSKYSRSMVP